MSEVNKRIAAGLSVFDKNDQAGMNNFIAQQSAHAERTGEEQLAGSMGLDDEARDRLLFYGRQDGAAALLNTIDLLKHGQAIRRWLKALNTLLLIVAALLAFIAWRLA